MTIDNMMQEFILLMNPLSFLLFVYGIALFIKSTKRRNIYIFTISLFTSIVMFSNAVFYRFFNDFITLPLLFQTSNFNDLSSSVTSNMNITDIFFFTDVLVVFLAIRLIPKVGETASSKWQSGTQTLFYYGSNNHDVKFRSCRNAKTTTSNTDI